MIKKQDYMVSFKIKEEGITESGSEIMFRIIIGAV